MKEKKAIILSSRLKERATSHKVSHTEVKKERTIVELIVDVEGEGITLRKRKALLRQLGPLRHDGRKNMRFQHESDD